MYEVGLGDSPMRIAGRLTGDPYRYRELLAANPHKPVVFVGGCPTFASLGVGEQLVVPASFGVGGYHGTSSNQDFQNLRRDLQAKTRQGRFAHVDKGKLQIDWPYHDQGWGNAAPRNHQDMMAIVGITKKDPFYPRVLAFFGLPPNTHITNGWNVTTTQTSGGGFSLDPSKININVNIDPGKIIKQLDPHINIDPGKLLHQIGIPTPDDMLHQLGLPSLGKILSDAGIPTDPADLFKDVVNPTLLVAQLAEHLPGIKEIAKYIPAMPDPTQMAMNIVNAATSGDPNKLKAAVLDVGHEVADVLSMVPGIGSGISGPLDAAIALLESGSLLRAALDLLLSEVPDIPPQIRDVFLRPAIDAVSDIVDHGKSISDAFISSFKEGVMSEAKAQGFPDQLVSIVSNFIDAVIQVILQHKPLDQAATGFAQKGLETAMTAAVSQAGASGGDLLKQLPSIPGGGDLLKKLPSLPGGDDLLKKLPSLPVSGTDIAKQVSALPGGAELLKQIPSGNDIQKALLQKTFDAVKSKIPADITSKVASLQQAYDTVKSVGNDSNTIHSLSQGIIALAKKDPNKTNPTVQKQIADLRTAIAAHRASIRSGAKKLDANLGTAPRKVIKLRLGPPPAPAPHKVIKLRLGPPAPAPAPVALVRRPGRPYEPYRHGAAIATQKRV